MVSKILGKKQSNNLFVFKEVCINVKYWISEVQKCAHLVFLFTEK